MPRKYRIIMRRLAAESPQTFAVWLDRAREGHRRVHREGVSFCPICCPVFAVADVQEVRS